MKPFSLETIKEETNKIFTNLAYSSEQEFQNTTKFIINLQTNSFILKDFYKDMTGSPIKGLCGDLAYITFKKLKDKFGNKLDLEIAEGHDALIFTQQGSINTSHMFLILNTPTKEQYVIDPSFHLFEKLKKSKYYIRTIMEEQTIKIPSSDMKRGLEKGMTSIIPIKIIQDKLLFFGFGYLDKNNFSMNINYKDKNSHTELFRIANVNGLQNIKEPIKKLQNNSITDANIELIKKELLRIWNNVEIII